MREMISDALRETTDFDVAATVAVGRTALDAFRTLKPDLITLDVQLSQMRTWARSQGY